MMGVAWVMTGGMSVKYCEFVGDARTWVGMERVDCVSDAPRREMSMERTDSTELRLSSLFVFASP